MSEDCYPNKEGEFCVRNVVICEILKVRHENVRFQAN